MYPVDLSQYTKELQTGPHMQAGSQEHNMIKQEPLMGLIRTYSDAGMHIIQDGTGNVYIEAVDPPDSGRTYTESTLPLPSEEQP